MGPKFFFQKLSSQHCDNIPSERVVFNINVHEENLDLKLLELSIIK